MQGLGDGWSLFLLTAVSFGFDLCRGNTVEPIDTLSVCRPALQSTEVAPHIGTYITKNHVGKSCIKATMGVQYIVKQNKRTLYFNLEPSQVSTSSFCGSETATLSLKLMNNSASVQLTFTREGNISYVSTLRAHIFPLPPCYGCASNYLSGVLTKCKLFKAKLGQSFVCHSESEFVLSDKLRVKLVPLQIQAFSVPEEQYGQEVECLTSFNMRVVPIIIMATAAGLLLIVLASFLIIRDHRREEYERM